MLSVRVFVPCDARDGVLLAFSKHLSVTNSAVFHPDSLFRNAWAFFNNRSAVSRRLAREGLIPGESGKRESVAQAYDELEKVLAEAETDGKFLGRRETLKKVIDVEC